MPASPSRWVLAYGRTCGPLSGLDLKRLVLGVADKPAGISVAVHIVAMRLHSDHSDKRTSAPEIAEAGRALLNRYEFHRKDGAATRDDYDLGQVTPVEASLGDDSGKPIARHLCRDLSAAVARYEVSGHDHDELMSAVFKVHPTEVLDELFGGNHEAQKAPASAR